ncbi:MAG: hypothetical protein HY887_02030 [Deltaproteobacteria bacterium]|nr:hypothetical protein [Deltaproteobacteria bacterium]
MLSPIQALEQIQKIDLEIIAVEEAERRYEREIEGIASEIKEAEAGISVLAAEAEGLRGLVQEVDNKIRENTEKVAKDEKRLNGIKNEKELNALTKEINTANKSKKQYEQEKAALSSKFNEKSELLKAREAGAGQKAAELERLKAELENKKGGWKDAVEKHLQSRESIKAKIRPDIFKKYEAIKSKRGGVGIALVKNETCQGCYIHIPPQVSILLKRGTEELMYCPHCHRILYVENQGPAEAV